MATFEHLMDTLPGDLRCLIYLDDIWSVRMELPQILTK